MTWTTPETKSDNELINQTIWNNQVRGNIAHLLQGVEPDTLINNSGATLSSGAVVVLDSGTDDSFTTTTNPQSEIVFGVVTAASIANGATGRVAVTGLVTVNVQGNVTRGNYLESSSTAGRAQDGGTGKRFSTFAVALDAYSGGGAGTVTGLVINSFVGGGIPTDSMHWYSASSAPQGYSTYSAASGRVIVGLSAASVLGNSIGTALGDDENRESGLHSHNIEDDGHTHGNALLASGGTLNLATSAPTLQSTTTAASTTGISACSSGSIAGTPVPYVVLLAIKRN